MTTAESNRGPRQTLPFDEARVCPACGIRWDDGLCVECQRRRAINAAPEDAPPDVVAQPIVLDARYEVQNELGEGNMGVVYLARDVDLDRLVAIKTLDRAFAVSGHIAEQAREEARALARIRHENVVQVYTFRATDDVCFLAMEYVRGRSLEEILDEHHAQNASLSVHSVAVLVRKVISGLAAVHRAGVVHRDVKPGNIVVEEHTGRPVLIDFGLAIPADPTHRPVLAASPAYMAPELRGDGIIANASPQSDIYALGCSIFELLTGRQPFETATVAALLEMHAEAPVPKVSAFNPKGRVFDGLVERALSKRAEDRYQSCEEMLVAFEAALTTWSQRIDVGSPPQPRSVKPREVRILVVDDDEDFAKLSARAAQIAFFKRPLRVTRADSAATALERAATFRPHLLLLDHGLPDSDGVAVLSAVRAMPGGEAMRVLVISGTAGGFEQFRYSALGVSGFVGKPTTFTQLVEAVEAVGHRTGLLMPDVEETSVVACEE